MKTPWYISIDITHYGCHENRKSASMAPTMGPITLDLATHGTHYGSHIQNMAPTMGAGKIEIQDEFKLKEVCV